MSTASRLIEEAMEAAQTYGDVYASSRDGGGRYTNKQMAEYVAKAASAKAALETYVALLEQTRDAAQAAGTKAVMERRLAEEELLRLRATVEETCPQCGSRLTLACPMCELGG